MVFKTIAYSNQGSRANNEDAYIVDDKIWLLADGLGGHNCGEVASNKTVNFVRSIWLEKTPMDTESLIDLIEEANTNLINLQKTENAYSEMRTTLVFAITDGHQLRYVNVGDSRFYLFRNGKLFIQSEDHSVPAALAKIGQIQYEDIRNSEDRNKLLKVMGNAESLNIKTLPDHVELESGDAFLLCSDGFWEYIYEQEMEIDLSKSANPKEWITFMLKRIMLRTEKEDNDNFTAICVMIEDNW